MALFEVTYEIFSVHFLFCHAQQMVLKALSKKAQHPMSTALPSSLSKIALTSWRRFPVVEPGNPALKRELEEVRTVTFSAESSHSRPHLATRVPGASWGNGSCHQLPKLPNAASRWAHRQERAHESTQEHLHSLWNAVDWHTPVLPCFSTEKNVCEKCSENCKTCTGFHNCTECKGGLR